MGPGRIIGNAYYGGDLMPTIDNVQSIGSSSLRWKNIYAASLYGNLSGNATTATKANIASDRFGIAYYDSTDGKFASTLHGNTNTALMGKGNAEPEFVSVTPSISITDGTASDAPKVNLTVLGVSGQTAAAITKATTGLWGVTKLSNTSSTTEEGVAATPKGVWAAIGTLNYTTPATSGTDIAFVTVVDQSAGKIVTSRKTVRDASTAQSGVVSTGAQTFAGNKSFNGITTFNNNTTTTGVATFNGNVAMNSAVSADSLTAGSLIVSGNTSLVNTTTTSTILPSADSSYNIGASGNKYATVYANSFNGIATKATAANLTTVANSIAYYTDTAGTFGSKASANGALYATGANGALLWGTLPVGQGGTGKTSWTKWGIVYASASDTLTNTAQGTNGALLVGKGDAAPTWLRSANGALYATTTDGDIVWGTLPVAQGGTGKTTELAAYSNLVHRGDFSDCNNAISSGIYSYGNSATNVPVLSRWGAVLNIVNSGASHNNTDNWIWQLCFNTSDQDVCVRQKVNSGSWWNWQHLLSSANYTTYTVKKDGTGATGTWGINISGYAARLGTTTQGSSLQPIYLYEGNAAVCKYMVQNSKLDTGIDSKTILTTGRYCTDYNHGITNLPTTDAMEWGLDVIATRTVGADDVYSWQIAYPAYTNPGKIYVRQVQNTTWTNWYPLVMENSGDWAINASSATILKNTRTINGTNFNGSTDITTAKWGTARNVTIGVTTKSVNGSDAYSWSIDEIGGSMHLTSYDFTATRPLNRYCTFDVNAPNGGPGSWINGWMSVHSNYLASYIVQKHRTDDWYVGWNQYDTSNGTMSTVPTWRKLIHDNNYTSYTVKKDGTGASGTWGISISGNATTATTATNLTNTPQLLTSGNTIAVKAGEKTSSYITVPYATNSGTSASCSGNALTATTLQNSRNITLSGEVSGTASFNGGSNITITTSCNTITTITKTLTVTTSWQDTGIAGTNLSSGTYIIQVSGFPYQGTSLYSEVFSGIMTWYDGTTNSTDYDDIYLHKAGHASNGQAIFLRTIRRSNTSGGLKLQIKCSANASQSSTVTFKFRKVI